MMLNFFTAREENERERAGERQRQKERELKYTMICLKDVSNRYAEKKFT